MKILAASCALLIPVGALAHAMLEAASPAVGSTAHPAPAELQLSFSEAIEPRFSTVVVSGAGGIAVTVGALRTDPANGKHLVVPVGTLQPGTYTVVWRAVSVDTHRTQGTYHFTISP